MKRLGYAAAAASLCLVWQIPASAEEAAAPGGQGVEEIVVTGSYIRGTPEDAALPVTVITAQEILDRGSPSALDLIRSMPEVTSILGETNQFSGAAQGVIGSGNINLRGLGGLRTLVLMNGRRTTITPAEGPGGVDTNLMPIAAIGRVEVLKDGAAATYGSDAIAGVVNFITRTDLDGIELQGEYRDIDGSDGDYRAAINWGWQGDDDSNVLLSYARQGRSELSTMERDYAHAPYTLNPTGWSAFSTPGTFAARNLTGGVATTLVPSALDSNCNAVGGFQTPGVCRFSYMPFDNLVEKTDQQQVYAEVNTPFGSNNQLHLEALYAETSLPDYRTSPAYPPLTGPGGPGTPFTATSAGPTPWANNPGILAGLRTATVGATATGLTQAQIDQTNLVQLGLWRPIANAGVAEVTGGRGGRLIHNEFKIGRVSATLSGEFETSFMEGIGWDTALTYSDSTMTRAGQDNMITRMQAGLNGLGGANCNGIPYGSPGSTCLFFNPFSNAIARNPAQGLTNPGFIAANANSVEMLEWMNEFWTIEQTQSLLVYDGVLNGELPFMELPGGAIGWAAGVQYRHTEYRSSDDNSLVDQQITPCPTPGDSSCTFKTGPFIFLGQFKDLELSESVYAAFGELAIPILDTLSAQFAVRYEDYGGLTGDTTNPKLSMRWQAIDALALRGSVGSTFRGPTPGNLAPTGVTGLQGVQAAGNQFKAIDFFGNPALEPEKADTYSVGFILQLGGFQAIVDYWNYDFTDQITTVPQAFISNAVGNGPGTGAQLVNCNNALRYLVTFSNNNTCTQGVTVGNDITRVRSDVTNGSDVTTNGVDMSFSYDFGEVFDGGLTTGIDATYINEYEQSEFRYNGVFISPTYDAVGYTNYQRFPGTIPEWRAIANLNYKRDSLNVRYEVRYIHSVDDDRAPITVPDAAGVQVPVTYGREVDAFVTNNLFATIDGPWETTWSLGVVNIFDEDPAEARLELGYDPFIGDPLGRTMELGVRKVFAGR